MLLASNLGAFESLSFVTFAVNMGVSLPELFWALIALHGIVTFFPLASTTA